MLRIQRFQYLQPNPLHGLTAGYRSLSGTILCVIDRVRFLQVTMTGSFSNLDSQLCKSVSTKIVLRAWKYVLENSQYLSDVICTFIR